MERDDVAAAISAGIGTNQNHEFPAPAFITARVSLTTPTG
jgi:hypothetical protein